MTQELKDRWLAALRSGRYKQGDGTLRRKVNDGYRYCCIGVLCDLVDTESWTPTYSEFDQSSLWTYKETGRSAATFLPSNDLLDEMVQAELMSMNDRDSLAFTEIADWIEGSVDAVS